MNKKTYITPTLTVVQVDAAPLMLSASNQFYMSDDTTEADAVMNNRHRDTWGNLWSESEKR